MNPILGILLLMLSVSLPPAGYFLFVGALEDKDGRILALSLCCFALISGGSFWAAYHFWAPSEFIIIRSILIGAASTPLVLGIFTYWDLFADRSSEFYPIAGPVPRLRWLTYLGITLLVLAFYLPQLSVTAKSTVNFFKQAILKHTTDENIGTVEGPKKPKVIEKSFVRLEYFKFGFGDFGVKLDHHYYPAGTQLEIIRMDDNTITIFQDGRERRYPKKAFNGAYESSGRIYTVKWDEANNRVTGLDAEGQILRKYYHFVISALAKYTLVAFVFFALTAGLLWMVKNSQTTWIWAIITFSFLLIDGCQGAKYNEYLSKFNLIDHYKCGQSLPELGFFYGFGNLFSVPLFIAVNLGLIYIAYLSFIFFHYLLIPHPAEKYWKKMQQGKMSESESVRKMADAMYDHAREGIPSWWASENWKKRIQALQGRMEAETNFMEALIKNIKERRRFK